VLLHGLMLSVAGRRERTPPASPQVPIEVSLQTSARSAGAPTLVAVIGQRPSGRGRSAAGSNPKRPGSPERAPRFQAAGGHAEGPGHAGPVVAETAPARETAAREHAALEVVAPASVPDAIPIVPSGSDRRAPSVDADRAFDALARAQLLSLSRGNGGGLAGSGSGRGGTGLGFATELSGRHVEHSPVVNAPVIVEERPVECQLPEALDLRTVVRVLVTRDGAPAVPRLLQSSGYERFDQCALRYVLAVRFAPGTNDRAEPLDVWMNVRVAPVTPSQVGRAM
jgi:hypothetical protein